MSTAARSRGCRLARSTSSECGLPSTPPRPQEHAMTSPALEREIVSDASDPIGLDGIEFIEYTTPRPQALGQVLEMMGFRPIARHRSREVTLYRQGEMNVVVNASEPAPVDEDGEADDAPKIAAIALRVRDAA